MAAQNELIYKCFEATDGFFWINESKWRNQNLSDFIKYILICISEIHKNLINLGKHKGD